MGLTNASGSEEHRLVRKRVNRFLLDSGDQDGSPLTTSSPIIDQASHLIFGKDGSLHTFGGPQRWRGEKDRKEVPHLGRYPVMGCQKVSPKSKMDFVWKEQREGFKVWINAPGVTCLPEKVENFSRRTLEETRCHGLQCWVSNVFPHLFLVFLCFVRESIYDCKGDLRISEK